MNKIKIIYILEYISLTLILSYFLLHNIFLVLIGITIAIYLININFINIFMRSINNKLVSLKTYRNLNKNLKDIKADSIQKELTKKDSKLTLVEKVEELGFIPSIDNDIDNENNAA